MNEIEGVTNKGRNKESSKYYRKVLLSPAGQHSSMSDSDFLRSGGPAGRGAESRSSPTPRMELLSPSKVKDRSQNVTEKVTQVRGPRISNGFWLCPNSQCIQEWLGSVSH